MVAKASDRLPVWWLFFLPLYWFPQGINFGLIQTYLLCVLLYLARNCRPSPSPLKCLGTLCAGRSRSSTSLATVASNSSSV